ASGAGLVFLGCRESGFPQGFHRLDSKTILLLFRVVIRSGGCSKNRRAISSRWRGPKTSRQLSPYGIAGAIEYGLTYRRNSFFKSCGRPRGGIRLRGMGPAADVEPR